MHRNDLDDPCATTSVSNGLACSGPAPSPSLLHDPAPQPPPILAHTASNHCSHTASNPCSHTASNPCSPCEQPLLTLRALRVAANIAAVGGSLKAHGQAFMPASPSLKAGATTHQPALHSRATSALAPCPQLASKPGAVQVITAKCSEVNVTVVPSSADADPQVGVG